MKTKHYPPLPRLEVIKAVERKFPQRIPLIQAKWWGEGFVERHGEALGCFDRIPEDAAFTWIEPILYTQMGLSWDLHIEGAHDTRRILKDWDNLDEFIEKLPDPKRSEQFERLYPLAERAHKQDRYLIFAFWRLFFERPWEIRGMANLLTDYYTEPEKVHLLYDALCRLYIGYIEHAALELQPDGFWTSDDLGHQTQLFMSPKVFRSFLKPYYARLGEALRSHRLHWWLHSCGNNTAILGDLAEAGVTVFHPVQKHTMDERAVAAAYGDRMSFLAGIDVQHVLQERDPDGVREEVRFLIDTFDQPEGGLCLAAGNGILPGTPLENIEAFLEEALVYGEKHRGLYRQSMRF
jgi:uroporphyrinogen decarboxylase